MNLFFILHIYFYRPILDNKIGGLKLFFLNYNFIFRILGLRSLGWVLEFWVYVVVLNMANEQCMWDWEGLN